MSTPAGLRSTFPLPSSPFVDPATGNINSQWLDFLFALFFRSGGAAGPSMDLASVAMVAAAAVKRAGDTMTGSLLLSGAPTVPLQAADKAYVDGKAVSPATSAPLMDGIASIGTSFLYARQDHVHPTDTSRYAASNPSAYVNAAAASAAAPVQTVAGRTGAITLAHADLTDWVTTLSSYLTTVSAASTYQPALGFTPYNATNPSGYQTAANVSASITAAAYTLPTATASILGGVKPDNVTIANASGAISVAYGTAANTAAQGNDSRITAAQTAANVVTAIAAGNPGGFSTLAASGSVSGAGFTSLLSPYALTSAVPVGSSATPAVDGTAAVGVATSWAHGDHVHPTDTSRAPVNAPTLTTSAVVSGYQGRYALYDGTQGTDGKYSDTFQNGGLLSFRLVNDAYSGANTYLSVTRTGSVINAVTLTGASIALTGPVTGSSTLVATTSIGVGTGGPTWTTGTAAPSASAPVGSLYSRAGGAVGATLYVSRGAGAWAAVAGV